MATQFPRSITTCRVPSTSMAISTTTAASRPEITAAWTAPHRSSARRAAAEQRRDAEHHRQQERRHDDDEAEVGQPVVGAVDIGSSPRDRGDFTTRSRRTPGGRASRDTSRPRTPPAAAPRPGAGRPEPPVAEDADRPGLAGGPAARCTQPLRHSRPMPSFRSMMLQHRLGRRLDDEQRAHRLVDLDHLPGQAVRRSLAAPSITPTQRRDVVRQLGPAAPAGVVDVGEVIFEVDAGADREDGRRMRVRIVLLGVVLGRVVGGEEGPPVQEQAARPLAAADDGDGVGRVAPLGPDLRQVFGPPLDVLAGAGERERQRAPRGTAGSARGRCGRRPRRRSRGPPRTPAGGTRGSGPGRRTSPSRCWCCASRRRRPSRPGSTARAGPAARGRAGR